MKIFVLIAGLIICGVAAHAQQDSTVYTILEHIRAMQQKKDSFFIAGEFPTYRQYATSDELKPDNSIFYTGLIAFTLTYLKPYFTPQEQDICDTIISRAHRAFPHFQSTQGDLTYNFWPKENAGIYPNSWFFSQLRTTYNLPDDLDDSAILWLSMDLADSTSRSIKKLIDSHANGRHLWIRNTYSMYRRRPAYSTWFGKNMPIDFDFCVLCNGLYFVFQHHLTLDTYDSATLSVVRDMIIHKQFVSHPLYISPSYGRTPVLLYTLGRLMGKFSIPELDSLKPDLLQSAEAAYRHAGNGLDSLMLATSIIRFGGPQMAVPGLEQLRSNLNSPFYMASSALILPGLWKKLCLPMPWIRYNFYCPAYNEILFLENRIISKA